MNDAETQIERRNEMSQGGAYTGRINEGRGLMSERPNHTRWPSDYVDEVMPAGRASPSDWIVIGPDAPMLAAPDYYGSAAPPERVMRPGDIVGFTSCITHDVINMALTANGYVFDRPPPVGLANVAASMAGKSIRWPPMLFR